MRCIGDLHGRFEVVVQHLRQHATPGETLIQVGDFGLGFRPRAEDAAWLRKLDAQLGAAQMRLLAIRGNHDDPGLFGSPWIDLAHIELLADYTVRSINGVGVLFVGGAISIDRCYRGPGSYWPDEGFRLDPAAIAAIRTPIQILITHTAPSWAEPSVIEPALRHLFRNDPTLEDELEREREQVAALYAQLRAAGHPIRQWVYGHFHQRWQGEHNGTWLRLLDVNEIVDLRAQAPKTR
jgi:hypothetical protein